jgi:hypothetical protein
LYFTSGVILTLDMLCHGDIVLFDRSTVQ